MIDLDSLFPALAFGFDGRVYINVAGFDEPKRLRRRPAFVGWALSEEEFAWEKAGERKLGELGDVVFATDGKVYGGPDRVPPEKREGRNRFHGVPLRKHERRVAFAHMDGLAAVITAAIEKTFGRRRRKER